MTATPTTCPAHLATRAERGAPPSARGSRLASTYRLTSSTTAALSWRSDESFVTSEISAAVAWLTENELVVGRREEGQ